MNTHADKMQGNKSQSVANATSKKQDDESSFQFVDNRPEAIARRKLQEKANNSPRAQQVKATQERVNTGESVIQGMFTLANIPITTLAALNSELALPTYSNQQNTRPIILPITVAHFNRGQSAAEVDTAVSNSNLVLYDYIDVTDIWDAIDTELVTITAPPQGYVQIQNGPFSAYMDSQFALTPHQQNLLVNAVNNQGAAVHQSASTHNMSTIADAYIHDYGANAIFSYQNMGNHRNIPMVRVLQQGNVNAGQHNF